MLNIISFLLIIVITLIRMNSGYSSNPLLNAGMLILTGYIFSLIMSRFRLPVIFGYIFAGVLAGEKGLEFIGGNFAKQMFFIENIFLMIILATAIRAMVLNSKLKEFSINFSAGAVIALILSILITGLMAPFSFPPGAKILFALFASIFSPLITAALSENKTSRAPLLQTAFGGFIATLVLWGAVTAFVTEGNTGKLRLAFMPLVLGISSSVTGFVWAFAAEKLIYNPSKNVQSLYSVAVMILIYPLIQVFGLDFIFLAIGVGLYNGLLSERESSYIENAQLPLLVVFVLFGTKLSLADMYLLGKTGWIAAIIITVIILFIRTALILADAKFLSRKRFHFSDAGSLFTFGPVSIILLRRFMPGFRNVLIGEMNFDTVYTICAMSIFLTIILSLCFGLLIILIEKLKPQKSQ